MLVTSLITALALGPSIGPEASPEACQNHVNRDAGWLLDEWAVVSPDSYVAHGEVRLSEIWGGCAILEQQTGIPEAQWPLGDGIGLIRYDPIDEVWRYSFTGDGVAMEAEGAGSQNAMLELSGELVFLSGSSRIPARIRWAAVPGGIDHQIWMLDRDNGQYTPWQTGHLRPVEETPRPRTPDYWDEP